MNQITSFLKEEEVNTMIKYLKSKNKDQSKINLEIYQSISNDLLQINSVNIDSKRGKELLLVLQEKYQNKTKKEETVFYEIPESTGRSINKDINCIEFEGLNEGSGEHIKQSTKTKLLTFTPKRLLNYYKEKTYLSIINSIVQKEKETYLIFDLIFYSKDIKKGYGYIPSDGFVRINMIRGPGIFLEVTNKSEARIEKYTGRTIYTLMCKIKNKDDLKRLKKQYVDDIGIMWSTGFEAYPIYEINYFKEKFKCFEGKK